MHAVWRLQPVFPPAVEFRAEKMFKITVNRTTPPTPYALFFLASLLLGFLFIAVRLWKKGVPKNIIGYSVMLNLVAMLYGAKMLSVITSGGKQNLLTAGFSSLGGVFGICVGIAVFQKIYGKHREDFWEVYSMALPLMYSVSKLGCFFAGCCFGISYNGIGRVSYTNLEEIPGTVFPVQLVESITFLLLFLVLCVLTGKLKQQTLISSTVVLCIILKFGLDFLRDSHRTQAVSVNQWLCVGMLLVFIIVKIKRKKMQPD